MFVIEDRGYILDTSLEPPHGRIAFFVSLCQLSNGELLSGFQIGPKKHAATSTIGLCRSANGGRSWQRVPAEFLTAIEGVPGELSAAELIEAEPGRLLLFATWFDRSDPERPLFDPVTEGILKSKQLLAISTDNGHSWSGWQELPTADLKGCAMTGPVLRWHDGTLGFLFESFKEFDDPEPGRHAAWIMVSQDAGRSFSAPMLIAQHPEHKVYYWDQRVCIGRRPGEFTALFWTHDLSARRDLNVHLRHGLIHRDSTGSTVHPGPMKETTVPGQIAAPLWLNDEQLLAFVVNRDRPGTLTLWSSRDGGTSWPTDDCLVVHFHDERASVRHEKDNVDFKEYWEDMGKWSFGHPAIQLLSDGKILLAWYAGTPDCMSLHWARVAIEPRGTGA